jgi:hypothetical protein
MTPFDLVVILLVANAVQNAIVGPDTSLQGGLVAAATLLVVNAGVARLRFRRPRIRHLVEGVLVVLVQHGELVLPPAGPPPLSVSWPTPPSDLWDTPSVTAFACATRPK